MVKHQAVQLSIAHLGGICNSWCHHSFLTSAQNWGKNCPQFDTQWNISKYEESKLGVNQIRCKEQFDLQQADMWEGLEIQLRVRVEFKQNTEQALRMPCPFDSLMGPNKQDIDQERYCYSIGNA